MPNTTSADWSESSPALSEPRRDGALEITSLRGAVRTRLLKEHEEPAAASVGGEHLQGSAKVYVDASAPTLRPDGTTALDADDEGRLWYPNGEGPPKIWTGAAWAYTFEGGNSWYDYLIAPAGVLPVSTSTLLAGKYIFFIHGKLSAATASITVTINGVAYTFTNAYAAGNFFVSSGFYLVADGTVTINSCSTGTGTCNVFAMTIFRINMRIA